MMSDLIDREKLLKTIITDRDSQYYNDYTIRAIREQNYQYAIDVVNEQPTVNAVPVVRGHWQHSGRIENKVVENVQCAIKG